MKRGQSLIELLLVIGLMAILIPAIFAGYLATRQGKPQQEQQLQATALIKEAADAVRSVRDNTGWNTLPAASTLLYYPHINTTSGAWELLQTADQVNGE